MIPHHVVAIDVSVAHAKRTTNDTLATLLRALTSPLTNPADGTMQRFTWKDDEHIHYDPECEDESLHDILP
jgi:hypothetical protein